MGDMEVPTVAFGKTQSGKTWRAFELAMEHDGPVVYCDVQWRSYRHMEVCYSIREVIAALHKYVPEQPDSVCRIDYLLDDYSGLHLLVDYLLSVHRAAHVAGRRVPKLLLVMDEVWRAAPRWADANNPAVRVFTEGLQHGIIGLAISQWVSQTSRLIGQNAYEWYLFSLNPPDIQLLSTDYRLDIPDPSWIADPGKHRYWRYNGQWYRGYPDGMEELEATEEWEWESDR